MGALNVTPGSFSDGGLFFDRSKAVEQGVKMARDGADIIDVGGESTRPFSDPIPLEEELSRVLPVIEELTARTAVPISIDTYKSSVAERAIEAGAQIINDISGLQFDPVMAELAAGLDCPVVIMHIKGTPRTMQQNPEYDDVVEEIIRYLDDSIQRFEKTGGDPQQIMIDPGIGFGKRVWDNLVILKRLDEFGILGKPVVVGTSRKSFIGHVLGTDIHEREIGTLATIAVAAMRGAHVVRVHDVGPARQVVEMVHAIADAEGWQE
jgi:dihydropteroate synthase